MTTDPHQRIRAALERITPPPPPGVGIIPWPEPTGPLERAAIELAGLEVCLSNMAIVNKRPVVKTYNCGNADEHPTLAHAIAAALERMTK